MSCQICGYVPSDGGIHNCHGDSSGRHPREREYVDLTAPGGFETGERRMEDVLIWSYEHNAWWAPNERGYVSDVFRAGRYTPKRAGEICGAAFPNEVIVPVLWAETHGRPTHHPYQGKVKV